MPDPLQILIDLALKEDVGTGDVTSEAVFQSPLDKKKAKIVAKEDLVVAGLEVVQRVYQTLDPGIRVDFLVAEGKAVKNGTILAEVCADIKTLLGGERVALNFLQHLSGIATLTRDFVDLVRGTRAKIVDTRKTLPGFRSLEKEAVRLGGGENHRRGLFDQFLIKDNHIDAVGSLKEAVRRARDNNPRGLPIEVETRNLREVREALEAGVDIILLDNMDVGTIREAVNRIDGRVLVEASGGIDRKNVRTIAETGVDTISIGALTHSAPAADIALKVISGI
ncbi:MAG: nicotinate-nucleotide diphosphorylase (carboxylating) [Deltaproteobacteria bacterium RIFCSPLOWO2_02_FULL_50_16]|nr:MAG: nicotinate-nucleotide diphosphorylase (carboxylating) [Deltaproteobacteria bacterium RIFCSPHIGHO2_02_FULL_50_15]OGQ57432.1 MAG: nicotinate-nucleotide diphosphorylase (carboxylating) [Deltaproteobacteria bacterium RIFCSPLOWO2_02_FULL_50_16]OGQ67707.1 MAG: nicotinate-nucleotide diphosphorylase (carboxylating) [Deltaproteobacteria bacterium RIFCSPLOWO2_12_FULL_50_11]